MEYMYSTGNEIVDQVAGINITGNVIPLSWFKTMVGESGKPMLLSIDLLADIVYWYKPKEIRDEGSGELVGFQKRFKADLLQRSYKQIEQRFGITKKQARNALDYLCKIGVVKKHLRNEKTQEGILLHNNMYLELIPEKLRELTYPLVNDDVPPREPPSVYLSSRVVPSKAEGSSLKGTTSTENTTKNTNKDYNNPIDVKKDGIETIHIFEELIKENIEYEYLINKKEGAYKKNIDEIVSLLVEIVAVPRKNIMIGGVRFPYEVVKSQFMKLKYEHIEYVLTCMEETTTKIKNIRNYLLTTLYNAPNTIDNFYRAEVNHDLYGGL